MENGECSEQLTDHPQIVTMDIWQVFLSSLSMLMCWWTGCKQEQQKSRKNGIEASQRTFGQTKTNQPTSQLTNQQNNKQTSKEINEISEKWKDI